jgi:hypothetical protein
MAAVMFWRRFCCTCSCGVNERGDVVGDINDGGDDVIGAVVS